MPSLGLYKLPATLAGRNVIIQTDAVRSNIPLLLSLDVMKKAKIMMDTATDTAIIFGRKVNLNFTNSGHYSVSLRGDDMFPVNSIHEASTTEMLQGEERKVLYLLHRKHIPPI